MSETVEDVYEAIREDPAWDHMRTEGIVLVPGEGASRPKIMIVGDRPGASENTARRPFVGTAGKVLRSLIEDVAQLNPGDYFLTTVVKYWPAGGRPPVPYETIRGTVYLRREWKALGSPSWLVAVGGTAKNALAPHLPGVTGIAGGGYPLTGGRILWPMIHPSWGIKEAAYQSKLEQHWEALGKEFRKWNR